MKKLGVKLSEKIKSKKIKYIYIEYSDTQVVEEQQVDIVKVIDGLETSFFEIYSRELSTEEIKMYQDGNLKERIEEINNVLEEDNVESTFDELANCENDEYEKNYFSNTLENNVSNKTENSAYNLEKENKELNNFDTKKKYKKRKFFRKINLLTVAIIIIVVAIFNLNYKNEKNNFREMKAEFNTDNYDESFLPNITVLGDPVGHSGEYILKNLKPDVYSIVCNSECKYDLNEDGLVDTHKFKYIELDDDENFWKDSVVNLSGDIDIYKRKDVIVAPNDDRYSQGEYKVGEDIPVGEYVVVDDFCTVSAPEIEDEVFHSRKYIDITENMDTITLAPASLNGGLTECQMIPLEKAVIPKTRSNIYTIGKVGTDLKPGYYKTVAKYEHSDPANVTIYSVDGNIRHERSKYIKLNEGEFIDTSYGFIKPVFSI